MFGKCGQRFPQVGLHHAVIHHARCFVQATVCRQLALSATHVCHLHALVKTFRYRTGTRYPDLCSSEISPSCGFPSRNVTATGLISPVRELFSVSVCPKKL